MTDAEIALVVDRDGQSGSAARGQLLDPSHHALIRLQGGQAVMVEKGLLQMQADGSYMLPLRFADLQQAAERHDQLVVPVVQEEVQVAKRSVESGRVRIIKTVDQREVLVDQPLMHEHAEVERVPINQMVDEAPPIRYDGDTMIIPVLEEVVVVEIRLMVREEIRVTRSRTEVHEPQSITLRRENVIVERDNEDVDSALNS
jgi:uncharacterized protein (TIGR02271 family)